MTRTLLLGSLPKFTSGVNVNRLDRVKTAEQFSFSKKQLDKAYNNWIQIFRKPGSTLSFEEYLSKMKEACINPNDIGNDVGKYNLSRYNDTGPYTNDSCRFILMHDNLNEQKRTSVKGRVPWNKGKKIAKTGSYNR